MDLDDVTLWPPLGLSVAGAGLELVWAREELLFALARLAAGGVHDDDFMPFLTPWTRGEPARVGRSTLQYNWGQRSRTMPDDWDLQLAVLRDCQVVGVQDIFSKHFPVTRVAETGSWLGRAFHGQGVGTRMRVLALHLLFEGLGAQAAQTAAFADNGASLGVTRKLGYHENGTAVHEREGVATPELRFRLDRSDWDSRPDWMRPDIELRGVQPVTELLGIG